MTKARKTTLEERITIAKECCHPEGTMEKYQVQCKLSAGIQLDKQVRRARRMRFGGSTRAADCKAAAPDTGRRNEDTARPTGA